MHSFIHLQIKMHTKKENDTIYSAFCLSLISCGRLAKPARDIPFKLSQPRSIFKSPSLMSPFALMNLPMNQLRTIGKTKQRRINPIQSFTPAA